MPLQPPERRWTLVVGNIAFVGLVTVATLPAYMFVDAGWRPLVLRLAAALVLGVLLRQVHKAVMRRVHTDRASAFDGALAPPGLELRLDRRLVELDGLVKWTVRSRRYFERIGWPRIAALAATPPIAPQSRCIGRGPSLDSLRRVIDTIERPQ